MISARGVAVIGLVTVGLVASQACGGDDEGAPNESPQGDACACPGEAGSYPPPPQPSLTVKLHRVGDAGTPYPIIAAIRVVDENDAGIGGATVDLSVGGRNVATFGDGQGNYQAQFTPTVTSGEVVVDVGATVLSQSGKGASASASVTALVLDSVGDDWDQPIAIGGMVNTAGTEDSSTISPDGEWLIVGTYLPIDTLCCVFHCGDGPPDGRNTACQNVLGPYAAPQRPNMPGADRILSSTRIVQADARLCVTSPDGGDFTLDFPDGGNTVPVIPTNSAYGFHRQPDGTFAEPFLIHFLDDGFGGGPFCFSFIAPVASGKASVLFANRREDDFSALGQAHHPTATTLTLGTENILGTYSCDAGVVQYTAGAISELPVSPTAQNAGNTSRGGGYLWSDDENVSPAVPLAAQLFADGGVAPWTSLALPITSDDRRQPVLRNGRVYFYRNGNVTSVSWSGADPSNAGSFGPPAIELAGETIPAAGPLMLASGLVTALGQPTFAVRPDGSTEMVFVYYRRTATGFDGQIGRVPSR